MNAIAPTSATVLAENAIYDGCAKVERSIATLAALRSGIAGKLPIPEAETLMDGIEDYLDILKVMLARALNVFQVEIERMEHRDAAPGADEIEAMHRSWVISEAANDNPSPDQESVQ